MHIHHENSQWLQLHARTTIIPIDSYRYHIYIVYIYIVYIYIQDYIHIYTHETMCCIPYLWCSHHHKPNISEQCSEPLLVDYYMGLYGVLTIQYIILFNRYIQVFSQSTEKFVLNITKHHVSVLSTIKYIYIYTYICHDLFFQPQTKIRSAPSPGFIWSSGWWNLKALTSMALSRAVAFAPLTTLGRRLLRLRFWSRFR